MLPIINFLKSNFYSRLARHNTHFGFMIQSMYSQACAKHQTSEIPLKIVINKCKARWKFAYNDLFEVNRGAIFANMK